MTLDEAMTIVLTEILMKKQGKPSYVGASVANKALSMIRGSDPTTTDSGETTVVEVE